MFFYLLLVMVEGVEDALTASPAAELRHTAHHYLGPRAHCSTQCRGPRHAPGCSPALSRPPTGTLHWQLATMLVLTRCHRYNFQQPMAAIHRSFYQQLVLLQVRYIYLSHPASPKFSSELAPSYFSGLSSFCFYRKNIWFVSRSADHKCTWDSELAFMVRKC